MDQFGAGELICYLPAAKFAYDLGIAADNPDIERSAEIFKTMSERLLQDSFYAYLQGKSIAIVGNSDCELNRRLGSAIDKHDVVIRFNNYFHAKPAVDYGQKTTVWVRNGQPEPAIPNLSINPEASSQYKFVLYADDYFHTFVSAELLPAMEIDFKSTRYQAVSFSAEIHQELRQRANLANPTSGAYVIWYLYRLLGTLENIDFYGFSFLNDNFKRDDCHGNEIFNWHEMSTENDFLKSLISKHPTKERVDL